MTRIRDQRVQVQRETTVRAAMVIKDVPPRLTQTRAPFEQHAKYSRGTKETGRPRGN